MLAALLSFVLRVKPSLGEDVVAEAISAGIRAVMWFVAFGVMERVAWSRGEYVSGLGVGIVAMLVLLLVQPGLSYPSVVGLLWIAVVLVLVLVAPPVPGWLGRQSWVSAIALPLFLGGGFGYLALVFAPAETAASNTQKAGLAVEFFVRDQAEPPGLQKIHHRLEYIAERVIQPLEDAEKDDRGNVRTRVLLASWWVQVWKMSPPTRRNVDMSRRGIAYAMRAQEANPAGREGYVAEYDAYINIINVLHTQVQTRQDALKKPKVKVTPQQRQRVEAEIAGRTKQITDLGQRAVKAIRQYLPRDPTDPDLHFMLATALFAAGDTAAGHQEALEADRLDTLVGAPRKLPITKREQLVRWAEKRGRDGPANP
jgi:hypothetical protein